MARWDEILTLPIQNPPTLEFSAADIMWSRVEGWRDSMDRLALIPFSRVNDFVRGESNNKECPTRFHVEARRRRPPTMAYKPKVDGILEYILYWCSFGPDDHRKGGAIRPSRTYSAERKTPAGRPNTKRGCICHFIVKRLIAEPSVALVIYNHNKHVDKKGLPCHGPMDKKAVGTKAMFAPYISDELRLQVMSLLYVGVPVETIMQKHTEMVKKQGGPSNRDDLLTHRYVRRMERKIRRAIYELDTDDAVSVSMWVENHRDHIFFYEDFSDVDTFLLGIQTEWQLQQMIRFGNHSLLASDSKFGTNKLKHPVHSILAFDSQNNAIPVAWIITPNFASGEIHRWMGALYDRVHTKDPTWRLGGFIVDDPLADTRTIREVLQCSVLISFWRIRHAWHKNLMNKCSEIEMRAMMARRLGEAVSSICGGNGDMELFEAFLEDFVDCSEFLDYFKAMWLPRLGAWITALKAFPLASAEVSAALESYHHLLKLRLVNEKDESIYQRADWLVDKLGTKVHSYYWLDEYSGKDKFSRYWRNEWKSVSNPWRQGLEIPDADVAVQGNYAKVVCQKSKEKLHAVFNPGSEFALCDCSWSRMGNICKHVTKSTRVYRDRGMAPPSLGLFRYNQTLKNILHCPPHDSVFRDHAIALAVCVRKQLNSLCGITNSNIPPSVSTSGEQRTASKRKASDSEKQGNDISASANQFQTASGEGNGVLMDKNSSVHKKWKAEEAVDNHEKTAALQCSSDRIPTELRNASTDGGSADNEPGHSIAKNQISEDVCGAQLAAHGEISGQASDACPQNHETETAMDVHSSPSSFFPSISRLGVSNGAIPEQSPVASSDAPFNGQRLSDIINTCASDLVDGMKVSTLDCETDAKYTTVQDCNGDGVESVSPGPKNIESNDMACNSVENAGVTNEATAADHETSRTADKVNGDVLANNVTCDCNGDKLHCNAEKVPQMDLKPCSVVAEATVVKPNGAAKNLTSVEHKVSDTVEVLNGQSCITSGEITYTEQFNADFLSSKASVDRQPVGVDVKFSTEPVQEIHVAGDSPGVEIDVDRGTAVAQ